MHRRFKQKMKQCLILLLTATLILIIRSYTHPSDMEGTKNMSTHEKGLQIDGKIFMLKDKPFQILCGAIHYFRVTPDAYEDHILKLKWMGLNSVDIYIPWNIHEPAPGRFSSKYADQLITFIELVKKHDLYVILRPGPYICSEWDLGGLPSWLLKDSDMKLRSTYLGFQKAVTRYFNHLLPLLKPYQFSYGGPIIAIQIENEYGSFDTDVQYMKFIKTEFEKHELKELFFVCDNFEGLGKYDMGGEVLQTINFMTNAEKNIDALMEIQPDKPIFVTEFWDGWFTHWQEKHHKVDIEKLSNTLEDLLKRGASVNFYMLQGGTNFGFMNGANANDDGSDYMCDATSYDYDAPISEGGSLYVEKYEAFKTLIHKYAKNPPSGEVESSLIISKTPTEAYGTIEMKYQATIDQLFNSGHLESIQQDRVCNMEALPWKDGIGQQYGYIVYQTKIQSGSSLNINNARDYVLVMVNGQCIYTSTKIKNEIHVSMEGYIKTGSENTVQILVENAGRVNYGADLKNQRKGIIGKVKLDGKELTGWNTFPLQFDDGLVEKLSLDSDLWKSIDVNKPTATPTVYKGTLQITDKPVSDTYISFPGWFKGVVFVNGQNLGRYWNDGPQKTLYVPRSWLRQNENVFVLFDLHGNHSKCKQSNAPCIVSTDTRDLGESEAIKFLI